MTPQLQHANLYQGHQGFEVWHHDLSSSCGTFHVEPPVESGPTEFRGAVTAVDDGLSPVQGARITSNCRHVHRARKDIRSDDKDFFYLVMQMGGEALMCQSDTQTPLQSGDLVLLDITQPCDFFFQGLSDQVSLILPRSALLQRYRESQLLLNRRIGSASSIGAMSGLLVQQLMGPTQHPAAEAQALFDALLALLRPAISAPRTDCPADEHPQSLVKAKALIERCLADETLCPEQIASAIGTSVRNLHRMFARLDTTVGRYILDRRLQRCADAIVQGEGKLTSIALAWGFRDFSHFSRAFKARFGQSPSEYRISNAR